LIQLYISYTETEFYLIQLTMTAYYSLVVIGLCMLMGYTGQISLGQAGFFAIGGYISAFFTTNNFIESKDSFIISLSEKLGFMVTETDLYGDLMLRYSAGFSLLFAIIVTVIISFIVGTPLLKLKGHYLAMATLGFGIIIYRLVLGTAALGAADGISNVPVFELFSNLRICGRRAYRVQNYYISYFFVIVGMTILINIVNSRVGRALRSIHGNEEAANAVGVNTGKYKLYIFVLAAVFASIGGFFLTQYNAGIGPSEAGVMKSVRYVSIVAVGGMANLWGSLIMGIILNFLSLRGYFGSYDDKVFGAILIIIMIFAPNGILKLPVKNYVLSLFKKKQND
jgi:branched-chain amino acid transport system permease protein